MKEKPPLLHPYQKDGVKWLASKNTALLADEMGLGKSAQAIQACDRIGAERILVLCPAVARINWMREFEKFSQTERQFTIVNSRKDPIFESTICSYDLASQVLKQVTHPFDVLILDECHMLKSTDTVRTAVVYGKQGLVRQTKRVWALSGTPAPNHAGELWPILYTFGQTKLTYDEFIKAYCEVSITSYGPKIHGTKVSKIPEIKELLKPVMLRRMKEDVMKELPPINFSRHPIEPFTPPLDESGTFIGWVFPKDRSKELYQKIDEQNLAVLNAISIAKDGPLGTQTEAAIGVLSALAPSVSTLRMFTGLQKIKSTLELVRQELESNAYEKLVIFAIHQDVIEGLRSALFKDFGAVTVYGGTNPETAQRNIDRFQTHHKCRVFIGNIIACGTAINLTAAHNVLFVEQSWTPGHNAQAAMRVHRMGQKKPVSVRTLYLPNTIDDHVSRVLDRKTRELTRLFDAP